MGKQTFRKEERLTKEKWIQELFEKGSSFLLHPFRVLYLPHPDSETAFHQVLISVSKRNFKKAVDRNTIKRRIREAYRLNKFQFQTSKKWLIAYIYVAKEVIPSDTIHQKLALTFQRFQRSKNDEKKD